MRNALLIFVFACVFVWSVPAQSTVSETKAINAADLKNLLPDSERQKPVLINFWATWCGPCHAEFPELVKIDAEYRGKGLIFNVVSVDSVELINTAVPDFLKRYNSTMPSFLLNLPSRRASAKAIKQIAPTSRDIYPLTLLFNKNGKLVYQKLGRINEKALRKEIEKILAK